LAVGSCSNSSDDAANSGTITVDAPTEVAATDASSTPTTSSSSISPTTTTAPTTMVDPTVTLIAEIEADLNEGEQVFLAGAADPASPPNRQALETYYSGDALASSLACYDFLVANDLRARPNPEVPSITKVLELIESRTDRATIAVCRVDAGVSYATAPDGSEIIFDNSIVRYDARVELNRIDGTWVVPGDGETFQTLPQVTTCD
jgi:hypothetical protein